MLKWVDAGVSTALYSIAYALNEHVYALCENARALCAGGVRCLLIVIFVISVS